MALYKEEGRVMYSKKDYTEEDIQWAKSDLNNRLDMMPADGLKSPIYAIIRKVSSSGLTRYISFYINPSFFFLLISLQTIYIFFL